MLNWLRLNMPLRHNIYRLRQGIAARNWDGRGPAPHPIKQRTVRKYASKHRLRILVETGTFYGDMVAAMLHDFDLIYSIELSEALYRKAVRRFRDYSHVRLIHGDSAEELGKLVGTLPGPALFWLDGHFSGGVTARGSADTPIFAELLHIRSSAHPHVVLIDDARCFGTDPVYPKMSELQTFIGAPELKVETDSFVIEPI
jgi:hypothetical protein